MAKNNKTHGRRPMVRKATHKPTLPTLKPAPRHANNRHHFQQSAVLEYCICGEKKEDPIHIRKRKAKPVPKPILQVGINPDNQTARTHVAGLLHWKFVSQVDRGLWEIETIRPWPVNVGFDASITLEDGTEIAVNVEWP